MKINNGIIIEEEPIQNKCYVKWICYSTCWESVSRFFLNIINFLFSVLCLHNGVTYSKHLQRSHRTTTENQTIIIFFLELNGFQSTQPMSYASEQQFSEEHAIQIWTRKSERERERRRIKKKEEEEENET